MQTPQVGQWHRFETTVENSHLYANPYADVTLNVIYRRPDNTQIAFWGFYDGGTTWRLRFMPDQPGLWHYEAHFSDGQSAVTGTFTCVKSDLPGMITVNEANPLWFGYKGGGPAWLRSFHVGDRFFAANFEADKRRAFVDWAATQGYNMLSIASHYLNRRSPGRGEGWDTPQLWPLQAAEFQKLEPLLNDLAERRFIVFPFAGFFGRDADFPTDPVAQEQYIRYVLARLGPYWNLVFNVSGPEPLLAKKPISALPRSEVNRLGTRIQRLDVFGHPLTVHNPTGDDVFKDETWLSFGTLQGPKTTDLPTLSERLLHNHHPTKPLYVQETLWSGNKYHPDYSDEHLRRNAIIILMAAGVLNFADNGGPIPGSSGDSSSGFSGSLDPVDCRQGRHDILKAVWDFFESLPWYRLTPHQSLIDRGYCLAEPGHYYLVFLPDGGSVNIALSGGPFRGHWIDAQNTHHQQTVSAGTDTIFTAPDSGDWFLYLFAA